jgi:hypothetical protein
MCLISTGAAWASYDGVQVAGEEKAVFQLPQMIPLTDAVISEAAKIYKVGCLRSDRVHSGSLFEFTTGSAYDQARDELADPSNFGSGGIVDLQLQLLPGIYDITPENLADVDILWAGLLENNVPLSIDEQQTILDFVKSGKSLVVIADVGPNFSIGPNSVTAPFGLVWDNSSWINANPSIIDTSHPIINGPFGVVSEVAHMAEGSIADLGLYASEIASNINGSSIAYIPPDALEPGSGPVVFFSDINEFTSNMSTFDQGDNRILFRNLFAYLASVSANVPPVADAGPDQEAVQGYTICFDGSGSSDANDDPLTYSWAFTAWPAGSTAEFNDSTSDKPCFTADLPGTYKVSLIVNDGIVDSAPSTAEAVVISYREAIDQLCPCDGPEGTDDTWKNHGQYVSCVSKSAENFLEDGRITEAEKDAICSEAGQSSCGKKK